MVKKESSKMSAAGKKPKPNQVEVWQEAQEVLLCL